ncbi:flavin reductase [Carboxylicivirga sp. A043]|uniref:flavin reductase n=1 Tax=Carboxylicivirga litoralis TaxID=2816963 RepID=UPI0021CB7270|nr:flavin reductase [Carboxylicivirga sp. A043]MCU4156594.1 flavin reductase [Carboxylicivirga sp. A043]
MNFKFTRFLFSIPLILTTWVNTYSNESDNKNLNIHMEQQNKSFEELYERIEPADYRDWLSKLMKEEDHTLITAGNDSLFNSMPARWDALGLYFNTPTVMTLFGASRYTLEFIRKHKTYTLSFLPEQHVGELYALGRQSGRNSDKMKETKLNYITTPSGNITYREAKVVIETQLFEITTVNPNDFYIQDGKDFVENGYTDANDYHKLVMGRVTQIWVSKDAIQKGFTLQNDSNMGADAVTGATNTTPNASWNMQAEKKPDNTKPFPLLDITLSTILAYAGSFWALQKKLITKLTHRKIWNSVLLVSFIVSGLLGLYLVFQINYHVTFWQFSSLRMLHINFGIVMAIVSVFHSFWHIHYFKNMLAKRSV